MQKHSLETYFEGEMLIRTLPTILLGIFAPGLKQCPWSQLNMSVCVGVILRAPLVLPISVLVYYFFTIVGWCPVWEFIGVHHIMSIFYLQD